MTASASRTAARRRHAIMAAATAAAIFLGPAAAPGHAQDADVTARGEYLAAAGGCANCHTDAKGGGAPYGGGVALKTPFGTFYGPNITADREHGIGAWSDADFIRALRTGTAPDGSHYYPAFPYTSFTKISDADMRAIKAYLFSLPPAAAPDRPHEVAFPFDNRALLAVWKWMYFDAGAFVPEPARGAAWNRGAYLVRALGHCGECHTPRDAYGGFYPGKELAGTARGPNGDLAPNLTPDPATGIGEWSEAEIADALGLGLTPGGDALSRSMEEVVANVTGKLSGGDLAAIAGFLKSLPPVRRKPAR
jgi:mono/diheme cytochrome c family protein